MRWKFVLLSSLLGCLAGPLPGLADNLTTALKMTFANAVELELVEEAKSADNNARREAGGKNYLMQDLETGLAAADSFFPNSVNYQVAFSPSPEFDLYAGYRFPQKDAFKCDITADVEFDGPYFGALIHF